MSNRYMGIETRRATAPDEQLPLILRLGVAGKISYIVAAALLGLYCGKLSVILGWG